MRMKLSCFDIILVSGYAVATSDCIGNWYLYSNCTVPIHIYIAVSISTILISRLLQIFACKLINVNEP